MTWARVAKAMRALTALALLAILAGCVSPEDPAPPPAPDPVEAALAPTTPPTRPSAANESAPAAVVPRTTAVQWEGRTASAACVMPAQQCRIVEEPVSSWQELDGLGVTGRVLRVSGTLTWTAETPATTELRVYVFALAEDGMPTAVQETRGPSPLAFDVDTSAWEGAGYAFSLHGQHEAGPIMVEKGQPFAMDATIVWAAT